MAAICATMLVSGGEASVSVILRPYLLLRVKRSSRASLKLTTHFRRRPVGLVGLVGLASRPVRSAPLRSPPGPPTSAVARKCSGDRAVGKLVPFGPETHRATNERARLVRRGFALA